MTAPDPCAVQARLLQAAAMLERRQYVTAEIERLHAEAAALDNTMSSAWPTLITEVASDMQTLAEQAGGG
ncbi:hypothetical protein [Nocardia australiensis]|uniref:hypothetical protein n=1 Tax=Nocardia australiensis TaxID=2887191 RepID=UPI001D1370BA|nr:hypothetical protein [Nocardia australiensis]